MVDPSRKVPDLNCEVQDLLLEVVDLKQEVPDLRSGGIRPNLTPGHNSLNMPQPKRHFFSSRTNLASVLIEHNNFTVFVAQVSR